MEDQDKIYECPKCGSTETGNKLLGDETFMACFDCGFLTGDDSQFKEVEPEEEV